MVLGFKYATLFYCAQNSYPLRETKNSLCTKEMEQITYPSMARRGAITSLAINTTEATPHLAAKTMEPTPSVPLELGHSTPTEIQLTAKSTPIKRDLQGQTERLNSALGGRSQSKSERLAKENARLTIALDNAVSALVKSEGSSSKNQSKYEDLIQTLPDMHERLTALKTSHQDPEQLEQALKTVFGDSMGGEIAGLKKEIDAMHVEIEHKDVEVERLARELTKKLGGESSNLQKTVKAGQDDLKEALQMMEFFKSSSESLSRQVKDLKIENETLQEAMNLKEEEVQSLKALVESLQVVPGGWNN